MTNIDSIIRGELRPFISDTRGDDYYLPALREILMPVELYVPHYTLEYVIPEFTAKTKYYKKLIDASVIEQMNNIYRTYNEASKERILYEYKRFTSAIKRNILQLHELIKDNGFTIEQLCGDNVNFKENVSQKECAYILNYLLHSLIMMHLDFQKHYEDKIDESKRISYYECYTRILGIMPPNPAIICERAIPQQIVITKRAKEVTVNHREDAFSFVYEFRNSQQTFVLNLWMSMTKKGLIEKDTQLVDFKACFTGIATKKKLKWIANKSLLKEFVKKFTDLQSVEYGNSKWQAACNTFVDKDGEPLAPEPLRKQQSPKEGAGIVDAVIQSAIESLR